HQQDRRRRRQRRVLDPVISADGRFVVFESFANDLVANDTHPDTRNIYIRDLRKSTPDLVSAATDGGSGNSGSFEPAVSADGRYVAFHSLANNLTDNDHDGTSESIDNEDVFVRDTVLGKTTVVSLNAAGTNSGNRASRGAAISADG